MTGSTSLGVTEPSVGRLLYRGAEADVILSRWQGMDAVFKVRNALTYRLPVLDQMIRRQRTLHEADIIHEAKKAGVATPFLYDVDVPASTIVMEFVEGERVKDLVDSSPRKVDERLFDELGRDVGKLHTAGIMHGDLTTANVIRRNGALVFIDFGLSVRTTRLEDQGVDLRLIKETLVGAHPRVAASALEALYRGYSSEVGPTRTRAALRQLRNIERRGRYARVE